MERARVAELSTREGQVKQGTKEEKWEEREDKKQRDTSEKKIETDSERKNIRMFKTQLSFTWCLACQALSLDWKAVYHIVCCQYKSSPDVLHVYGSISCCALSYFLKQSRVPLKYLITCWQYVIVNAGKDCLLCLSSRQQQISFSTVNILDHLLFLICFQHSNIGCVLQQ